MVNEKKVSLMTKIAIYEKKEGNRNLQMSKFYRSDYIRYNVLKTLVAATVVYWAVVGAYVYIKFDELLAKINELDYFGLMYKLLGGYVAFCLIYFFIGEFVYSYKFYKAKKGLVRYNVNLRRLIELEGGKKRRKKKKPTIVGTVVEEDELEFDEPVKNNTSVRIKRSDMVSKRMEDADTAKRQQVMENAQKLKEKYAAREEARLEKEKQREQEKLLKQEQQRLRYEKSRMEQQRIREEQQRQLEELRRQQMFVDNDGNDGRSDN